MRRASEALEFEKAAQLRDRILGMKDMELGVRRSHHGARGMPGAGPCPGAFAKPAARRPQRSGGR